MTVSNTHRADLTGRHCRAKSFPDSGAALARLLAVASLVLCGGLLASCGGGGGGGGETETAGEPAPAMPMPPPSGPTPEEKLATRQNEQRNAIWAAIYAAEPLVNAVNDESFNFDAEVERAEAAITAIATALGNAVDLLEDEKAMLNEQRDSLLTQLNADKDSRMMAITALRREAREADRRREAEEAAAREAARQAARTLYDAIGSPDTSGTATHLRAAWGWGSGVNRGNILVWQGADSTSRGDTADAILTHDTNSPVPAHRGWQGRRYSVEPAGGGSYVAIVYADSSFSTETGSGASFNSYGWWEHTAADGQQTISAFGAINGSFPGGQLVEIAFDSSLLGTARYTGGAVGFYALTNQNDSGRFFADVELNATFVSAPTSNDPRARLSGTINNFVDSRGEQKDWSVELKEARITQNGILTDQWREQTAWTISGSTAADSGDWWAYMKPINDDGNADGTVFPRSVAGAFYTEFGNSGKMVGGFGASLVE